MSQPDTEPQQTGEEAAPAHGKPLERAPSGLGEGGWEIFSALVDAVEAALSNPEANDLPDGLRTLHPADMADLVEQMSPDLRIPLIERLGKDFDPETVCCIEDESLRSDLLGRLRPEEVSQALETLDSDDALDLVAGLDLADQQRILAATDPLLRSQIQEGLSFPEDSAGRLMQREFIAVPPFWSVGQVIDFLRLGGGSASNFHHIFLCDIQHRPIGVAPLGRLLRSRRPVVLRSIMTPEPITVATDLDQEEVGLLFRHYGLVEVPVIDKEGRMVGVITADDVVDVVKEEAEEDMLALSGLTGDVSPSLDKSVISVAGSRLVWLGLNLLTACLASVIIVRFEATLTKLVILAALLPIVVGLGGNAATQTMTVTVRALATHELAFHGGVWWAVWRELMICVMNGIVLAGVAGIVVGLVTTVGLGWVIAVAIAGNFIIASLAGVTIPFVLDRMRFDPAVGSPVLVTGLTDIFGIIFLLGLATLALI